MDSLPEQLKCNYVIPAIKTRRKSEILGSHGGDYEEYLSSVILRRVVRYKLTDVSEERTASIFRVGSKPSKQQVSSKVLASLA
jgi:hypothetical protein